MTKKNRFTFRCDPSFLEEIDDWRRNGQPILSQSEAIRLLALRGAAMDRYFTTVLENSLEDLISAGIVSDQANLEIYKRFQNFVTKSLDQAALLSQQARQNPEMFEDEPFHDEKTAPETPAPDKSAPKMQRYSR